MNYAIKFNGHGTFTPNGKADIFDVNAHNRELERAEIEQLKTHPEKLMLYVKAPTGEEQWQITTWLGTIVSSSCYMGERANVGFGMHTYRRNIDCRIFGARYVGWYMESSGNYCRLRKAKKQ